MPLCEKSARDEERDRDGDVWVHMYITCLAKLCPKARAEPGHLHALPEGAKLTNTANRWQAEAYEQSSSGGQQRKGDSTCISMG